MKSKVDTLIGFAVKARRVVFGTDNIEKKGRVGIIIVCHTLSQNSLDRLVRVTSGCRIIRSDALLEDIVHKTGVKAIAITDRQMSEAILNNLTSSYTIVREEKPV